MRTKIPVYGSDSEGDNIQFTLFLRIMQVNIPLLFLFTCSCVHIQIILTQRTNLLNAAKLLPFCTPVTAFYQLLLRHIPHHGLHRGFGCGCTAWGENFQKVFTCVAKLQFCNFSCLHI